MFESTFIPYKNRQRKVFGLSTEKVGKIGKLRVKIPTLKSSIVHLSLIRNKIFYIHVKACVSRFLFILNILISLKICNLQFPASNYAILALNDKKYYYL